MHLGLASGQSALRRGSQARHGAAPGLRRRAPKEKVLLKLSGRLALACLLSSSIGAALVPAAASAANHTRPAQHSLADALAPDGSLKARSGSYDARGFRLRLSADGRPRFTKASADAASST